MASITMKQGEAKSITFTIKDGDGVVIDCSATTCTFVVVEELGDTPIISKTDSDFDKTDAATGILVLPISATDSAIDPKFYIGEIKIIFTATNIDKSENINFRIMESAA